MQLSNKGFSTLVEVGGKGKEQRPSEVNSSHATPGGVMLKLKTVR